MTISEIFSKKFLFSSTPPSENPYFWYQVAFFGLILIIAIVLFFAKKIDFQIRVRQLYCYFICGILGFIYLFSRHEKLPWLGSRFFLVLVLATLIIWITIITIWMAKYIKTLDKEKIIAQRYKKYLPKKKKK